MKSDTETIIKALRVLARDIQSDDGVANAAIAEAADRLQEQRERIRQFGEWLNMRFDKAQKRYYEEQVSGDGVSIASTSAEYLAFRDACRDLSGFVELKEAKP